MTRRMPLLQEGAHSFNKICDLNKYIFFIDNYLKHVRTFFYHLLLNRVLCITLYLGFIRNTAAAKVPGTGYVHVKQ
jgi:hypothetical protein